jgi:hypothetical protein
MRHHAADINRRLRINHCSFVPLWIGINP